MRGMTLAPSDMICFAVYSATHAMQQAYRPLLEPLGITYPQYIVLSALWTSDGAPTVGELTRLVHLESNTLTPLLKRLASMGLVRRKRDKVDERLVRIEITAAGQGLRRKAAGIPACIAEKTGLALPEIERLRLELAALGDHLRAA